MNDRVRTLIWLGAGFLLFGFVQAYLTGISTHEGIFDTLLTSTASFAGGSILTFAGFKLAKKKNEDEGRIDAGATRACARARALPRRGGPGRRA